MKDFMFRSILLFLLFFLAPIASVTSAHAAPGDYLFQWGAQYHFSGPTSVTLDSNGNIYVVDALNSRIQKFNSSGTFLTTWGTLGSGNGQFNNPFGIAVDSSNNVYVSDSDNNRVQKFDSSGNYLLQWGSAGNGSGQFALPTGLAVDSSNNIYVADTQNSRIQVFNSTGTPLKAFGSYGSLSGQFNNPFGVAVDGNGNIYVADSGNNRIQTFNSSWTPLITFGSPGTLAGQFDGPSGITVDSGGNIYVADSGNDRVQTFNSSGTPQTNWGGVGYGDGQFYRPNGIALDGSGNVYVADTDNDRIQSFSTSGVFKSVWESFGSGNGQFVYPAAVTVDGSGYVYVADVENNRIQKFDSSGNYVNQWGSYGSGNTQFAYPNNMAIDSNGNIYVSDSGNYRILKLDSSGNYVTQWNSFGPENNTQFSNIYGLAIDSSNNVYVADSGNHCIVKFDSSGNYLTQWGSYGKGDSQFYIIGGLAVDSSNNVYVADTYNYRIQKFGSSGNYLTQWGSYGTLNGQFAEPYGVAVDSNNNVYVADYINNNIQVFSNTGTYITKWGSAGPGNGQLNSPIDIAVNTTGTIAYVADVANNRVQAFVGNGIAISLPTIPIAVSPSGSVSITTPPFTFNAVAGATGYQIYLQNNTTSTGSASAVFSSSQAGCATGTGTCSITLPTPLVTNDSYSWVVSALNSLGQGPWSSGLSFIVGTVPPALTIISPNGGGITTTPAFTFNAVAGATGYQIYLQNNTTSIGSASAVYTPAQAGCASGTGTCSITLSTPLVTNDSYSWVASALNSLGQGPWSSGLNFIVSSIPPVLTIISPTGSGITTTPAFTFNAVAGATGYQIYLQNNTTSTGGASAVYTPTQAGCASGTGTCSITLSTPLVTNDSYSWVASALNSAGQGPWSTGLNFNVGTVTIPPTLTIISPTGSGITTTPAFTFNAVAGATGYQIYLQNNTTSTGNASAVYTPAQAGCASGTGTCSITLSTPLITNDSYSWVASALNSAGQGPWSTGLNFNVGTVTIPPALTIISPTGSGITTTPAFTFNAVAGATGYQIYLQNNTTSTGNASAVYTPAQAGCASGTGTCSITLSTPLVSTDNYSWVGSALNSAGQGPWSTGLNFEVQ